MIFSEDGQLKDKRVKETLLNYYIATGNPVMAYDKIFNCIVDSKDKELRAIRELFIESHFVQIFMEQINYTTRGEEIMVVVDQFGLSYGVLGLWHKKSIEAIAIIGPFNMAGISLESYKKRVYATTLSSRRKRELYHAYSFIKPMTDMEFLGNCKVVLAMSQSDLVYSKAIIKDTIHLQPTEIIKEETYDNAEEKDMPFNELVALLGETIKTGNRDRVAELVDSYLIQEKHSLDSIGIEEKKVIFSWVLSHYTAPLTEVGVSPKLLMDQILYYQKAILECEQWSQLTIIIENMTQLVLSEVNNQYDSGLSTRMNNVKYYIHHHLDEELTLEKVAKVVHMCPKYFSSYFKKSTGKTFKSYINERRVKRAKRLLDISDMSILDVSLSVGFKSQSYFSKVFRQVTGMTPHNYREKAALL